MAAVVGRSLDKYDPGVTGIVGIDEHQDRGGSPARGGRLARQSPRPSVGADRHEGVERRWQRLRERIETRDDLVEAHPVRDPR